MFTAEYKFIDTCLEVFMNKIFLVLLIIPVITRAGGYKNANWGETKAAVQKKLPKDKKEKCYFDLYGAETKFMDAQKILLGMPFDSSLMGCNSNYSTVDKKNRCNTEVVKQYSITNVGVGCGIFLVVNTWDNTIQFGKSQPL